MVDLFSEEFLVRLRQEAQPKTKTSRAVLNAIKDLSSKN